jgi:nucleoside-diphosphate-sugar epimerase
MAPGAEGLTVAVTGPTGTFGFALAPLLEADERIARVRGIARRPFDPADHGWGKMTYHRGDVRDVDVLAGVFAGADVVVHLAFLVTGTASAEVTRAINVDGTLNAFRAAARAGVSRFVYASSAAAYGFFPDNPVGMTEDWPTRPDHRFFYAEEKAELERLLHVEAVEHPTVELYLLRPPIVLGPHALGAKDLLPRRLVPVVSAAARLVDRFPVKIPVILPAVLLQLIHEDDVGRALVQCIVGAGPPGAYNIAGGGTVTAHDVARELGLAPIGVPLGISQWAARAVASIPVPAVLPPVTGWAEALSHPAIVDTTRAERDLAWRPAYTSLEALQVTLHPDTEMRVGLER